MLRKPTKENDEASVMHRRRITLKDGRYMIFYTFDDDAQAAASAGSKEAVSESETEAEEQP
jgi:predicted lipoprotein with Yx(FWY)xxD motif